MFTLAGSWLSGVLCLQGDVSVMLGVPGKGALCAMQWQCYPRGKPRAHRQERKQWWKHKQALSSPCSLAESFSFRKRPFPILFTEEHKGNWNICIRINMILFCALLQVQWCSFKDSDFNTEICFGGQLKCVHFHRSLPKFWIQYPLNPLVFGVHVLTVLGPGVGSVVGAASLKLPCWVNCFNTAFLPLCLKFFFLISPLICKLRTVHIYKPELSYQRKKS